MRSFFSSRRRHTRFDCDWSSDVCSSDLWKFDRGPATCPVAVGLVHRVAVVATAGVLYGVSLDRKSVVQGKRVDLDGGRYTTKKKSQLRLWTDIDRRTQETDGFCLNISAC